MVEFRWPWKRQENPAGYGDGRQFREVLVRGNDYRMVVGSPGYPYIVVLDGWLVEEQSHSNHSYFNTIKAGPYEGPVRTNYNGECIRWDSNPLVTLGPQQGLSSRNFIREFNIVIPEVAIMKENVVNGSQVIFLEQNGDDC